jgi:hypothetical protein
MQGSTSEELPEFRAPAVAIRALQVPIQGWKPGPKTAKERDLIMRDLELQDTVQSAAESKEKTPRWRGPPKRALSPSSQAVQRANARMPPMWNKFLKPPGFSGRDLRAASTLLVLNHHAQLLALTMEELVVSETL